MRCLRLLNVLYKVDESFKYPLHGLAQIAEQMEPVRDLDSLRRSLPATSAYAPARSRLMICTLG